MAIAQSKLTAQGQISVPAEIRKRLGVGPGSVLEWDEQDSHIIVRRVARYTSADMHRAVFGQEPKITRASVKEGIRKAIRKRHGRS